MSICAYGVEVKSSAKISFSDTKSMREFLKTHPEVSRGKVTTAASCLFITFGS